MPSIRVQIVSLDFVLQLVDLGMIISSEALCFSIVFNVSWTCGSLVECLSSS